MDASHFIEPDANAIPLHFFQTPQSPSASDELMEELTEKLDAVENEISNMESKLPGRLESNELDLNKTKNKTEEFKVDYQTIYML